MPTRMAVYVLRMTIRPTARRLGSRLHTLRGKLTQEEFSEMLGLPQQKISRLEGGKGWEKFAEIWEALESAGLDPQDLLNEGRPADAIEARFRRLLAVAPARARETALAVLELSVSQQSDEVVSA